MKFDNLFQDPTSDSQAPYADTLILDGGGMDVRYGGETVAHVSFENIDQFEVAYHAMDPDFEPAPEWTEDGEELLPITVEELIENQVHQLLTTLGELRGWERS